MNEIKVNPVLIKELIVLARKRRENYSFSEGVSSLADELPQSENYEIALEKLNSFMSNLTFDEIKVINAVMYLGRDTSENEIEKFPSEYLLKNIFNSLPWNTKEIEISMMVGKFPLDQYLEKGLEIITK